MSNFVDRMEIGREYERLKVQQYGDVNATISKEEILNLTLMAIDSCPTADVVEVKHGRWIGIYDGYADGYPVYDEWECGCCGYIEETEEMPTWNYCPNCGAKMDERKEE